jgi:hypothetical protein
MSLELLTTLAQFSAASLIATAGAAPPIALALRGHRYWRETQHRYAPPRPTPTPTPTLTIAPPITPSALPAPAPTVPTTASLERILLGYTDQGAITCHARQLCHVAIAGATGGGKSSIMRLILGQLLAAGAKVLLIDPHFTPHDVENGEDWRPIATRLSQPPAVSPAEIAATLQWASAELQRRLELRRAGQGTGKPIFMAFDELPAIVARVESAPPIMGELLREGRKVGLFLIGSSQDFLVKTIGGGGAVRDCYRTAYYVGGDQTTARVLLDVSGRVDDGRLGKGTVMLRSAATPTATLARVPYMDNDSLAQLLAQATAQATTLATTQATAQATTEINEEDRRAAMLFLEGNDPAAIVQQLRGITSSEGRRYQTALTDTLAAIRRGLPLGCTQELSSLPR